VKTIVFEPNAAKQFDKLPVSAREQILDGLTKYAISGIGDVKKLRGQPESRLRIGPFRVIFLEDRITVITIEIVRRNEKTYR
jgi:mRNA interferase RelE/StbE